MVNASAMTNFNLRIPGLTLTVVQADGQDVRPVTVDELQIAVAETYDLIVTPTQDRAYTLVAEAWDRSGMARGTLAPRMGASGRACAAPPAAGDDEGYGDGRHGPGAMAGGCSPEHAAMGHCQPVLRSRWITAR